MSHHMSPGAFNATAASPGGAGTMHHRGKHMMMHMSFYWGHVGIILVPFASWPGHNMYVYYTFILALVFLLAVAAEWLTHSRMVRPGPRDAAAGVGQTVLYTTRVGVSYVVMLAVMSFNVGVFMAAMAGMGCGFFLFGNKAVGKMKNAAEERPASCHGGVLLISFCNKFL